jgi:hypothetical protein
LRDGAPVELPANTPIHAPPKQAATGRRRNGGFRRGSGANSFRPQ